MKKLYLIFWMCLFSLKFFGQSSEGVNTSAFNTTKHSFGDASVSLICPNVFFDSKQGTFFGGGLKLRMFVGKRLSFDSDLVLGRDYTHFGPGIIGLPLWYIAISSGFNSQHDDGQTQSLAGFLFMGAVMVLSAEHFAYHIPVGVTTEISPYVSLLRFKQLKQLIAPKNDSSNDAFANCALGVEINQTIGRFIFSPYLDYEMAYSGISRGMSLGFSFGYYFHAR